MLCRYSAVYECLKNVSFTYLKMSIQIVLHKEIQCSTAPIATIVATVLHTSLMTVVKI